ncbi:MAG: nitrate reductase [Pseudoruegeria sp.]
MSDLAKPHVEDVPKSKERLAVFLLLVVFVPVLSIAIVGGWGFFIWMSQIILGPPGS